MAVWQWTIYLVPAERVREFASHLGSDLASHEFESLPWWLGEPPDRFIEYFDERLERDVRPHSKNSISWGDVTKNDVSVGIEGQKFDNLVIRIDARDPHNFLSLAIEVCETFDLWIYDFNAETFVPPIITDVQNAFASSKAAQFSTDSKAFFRNSEYLNYINDKNSKELGIKRDRLK